MHTTEYQEVSLELVHLPVLSMPTACSGVDGDTSSMTPITGTHVATDLTFATYSSGFALPIPATEAGLSYLVCSLFVSF